MRDSSTFHCALMRGPCYESDMSADCDSPRSSHHWSGYCSLSLNDTFGAVNDAVYDVYNFPDDTSASHNVHCLLCYYVSLIFCVDQHYMYLIFLTVQWQHPVGLPRLDSCDGRCSSSAIHPLINCSSAPLLA